jgi:hypothetical protein
MSNTLAKVVIIGIPLILSLSWFGYWVVRLHRFGKSKRTPPGAPSAPPRDV